MDFTKEPVKLGPRIEEIAKASPHWPHGEGFVVAGNVGKDSNVVAQELEALAQAAVLHDPTSGRTMTGLTSEPQLQTYMSTLLAGTKGKKNLVYPNYAAICL